MYLVKFLRKLFKSIRYRFSSKIKKLKYRKKLIVNLFHEKKYKYITFIEVFKLIQYIFKYDSDLFIEEKIKTKKYYDSETYYVIRRTPPGSGFFSNFHMVLNHVVYAKYLNYLPIVDFKNYSNYYKNKKIFGNKDNSWEYFFNQPNSKNLDEILQNENIILSCENIVEKLELEYNLLNTQSIEILKNKEQLDFFSRVFRENIFFNTKTNLFLQEKYKELFDDNQILGISIRGTDYVSTKPKNHYIQPSIEMMISKVDELMKYWKTQKIFISTEDKLYRKSLIDYFGTSIIMLERNTYDRNKYAMQSLQNRYSESLDYLLEIYLLSKCNYIVGAPNGGFNTAFLFNNGKFRDSFIFDLGKYL